ncbi:hypothetical protein PtrV1_09820 [Pyrenophora tritici-repentis]|uniref:Uncharacterized protein n=1 Tax=Pyrenophora tritici-repentis TaxID=45151 RepID=A0A317A2R9_9PLEO|nr:hypothetical protein PtrV1_09820 [Pyrenophora tritici-repentis]KAF7566895.1 hypothetical protein PtrM4_134860 [Pyrenophora tritici-repentis]
MLMEIIARQSTRDMIKFANPEAESALWRSPRSVATYAIRLFKLLKPQIVLALSAAISKIHISFDGWTTKGGKRGFFRIVAHFATAASEAIAAVVIQTLREFGITPNQLGYFVLDNASNNDTAIAAIARDYGGFDSIHHRLRCSPHTINLIGQALLFGDDKDSYNNVAEQLRTEELYMREWRRHGQLGTLIAVINFIRTPQQHELFQACQCDANKALPADDQIPLLTPVRPVVTRWNSYHAAIKRATKLHGAFNRYMEHHIKSVAFNEKRSGSACKDVPAWMRQGGLAANDWATITEYQNCLKPLKIATKRLEGRGKVGSFGAIYEVLPVFEYILRNLEELAQPWIDVNFNAHNEAPEDHLHINLRAAWNKADAYYNKLDDSPVYYAATCLHPLYKYYCENSWSEKLEWIEAANKGFQRL